MRTVFRRFVFVAESTTMPVSSPDSALQRTMLVTSESMFGSYKDKSTPFFLESLRKRLTVDPMLLKKKGKMWLPQLALMEDMLNFTSTVLMVDSTRQDEPLSDDLFALPALQ